MAKLKTGRHTGAIKTHRQSLRRQILNRRVKQKGREAQKEFLAAVDGKDKTKAAQLLKAVSSAWDKAAKRGTVHWKTAARKKSRLALRLAKASA